MLTLLAFLDGKRFYPRTYMVSTGDQLGTHKVDVFEKQRRGGAYRIVTVARARRVLQPWATTPFTAIRSFVSCLAPILHNPYSIPDLILCNGPGSCLMPCVIARLLTVSGR